MKMDVSSGQAQANIGVYFLIDGHTMNITIVLF